MTRLAALAAVLSFAALSTTAEAQKTGAEVYATCSACHQANGQGVPGAFPPLAGSEWVNGKGDIPIAIVLHGLQGPLTVKGQKYNGVMAPWGTTFNDEQIAAVVTYIRSQWGNKAPAVTKADVARVRAATKAQKGALTEAALKKL
ncbi:MAG: cytochrome c [Gemmatimonadaceae bacterium]|nr:cytochrome c [Gemmatimonadaceae bacterium]